MGELKPEGALLLETFGAALLSYVCAEDHQQLMNRLESDLLLADAKQQVIGALHRMATTITSQASQTGLPVPLAVAHIIGRFVETEDTTVANVLRLQAGGSIDLEVPDDGVLRPLTLLLRDAFPLLLLPDNQPFGFEMHLSSAVWNNPRRESLLSALREDADLARLFVTQRDGDSVSMVSRSTGTASTLSLWMLPTTWLANACRTARVMGDVTVSTVGLMLKEIVDLARRAIRAEPCEIVALIGFTGVLLEDVDHIELPFGVLRPVREGERSLAPPSLEGRLSASTPEGEIVINYAGDLVLETTLPYAVRIEPMSDEWELRDDPDLGAYKDIEKRLETIRLASLLAVEGQSPLTLAPTWRFFLDPLASGMGMSWSDPRQEVGMSPRKLGSQEAGEIAQWVKAVHAYRTKHIDVAIRRTVLAFAHRADPLDALVDLVIAWENLFGSRHGEPTLRISASLAWLLGTNAQERENHRRQAVKAYGLRSDIVHGNRLVSSTEAAEAVSEARRLTLGALRKLFSDRTDLLALRTGDERSRVLILNE